MKQGWSRRRWIGFMSCAAVAACSLMVVAAPAHAEDPATQAAPAAQEGPTKVTDDAAAGARTAAAADQQTAAERAAMIADEINRACAARKAGEELPPARQQEKAERLPGGALRARPPVSALNIAVVRVGADGGFQVECTEGPDKASVLMYDPPAAGTAQAEEE